MNKNLAFDLLQTHSVDLDGVEDAYLRRIRTLRAQLGSRKITESELCTHVEALDQARHYLISQAVPSNQPPPPPWQTPPPLANPPAGLSSAGPALPIQLPPTWQRHFPRNLMLLAPLVLLGVCLAYLSSKNGSAESRAPATSAPTFQPPRPDKPAASPTVEVRRALPATTPEPLVTMTLKGSPSAPDPAPTAEQALSFTFAYVLGTQNGKPISLEPYCTERLGTWYDRRNIDRAEAEKDIAAYYRRWPYQETHWVENECAAREEGTHFVVTIPFAWTASDGQRTKTGNSVLHATVEFSNGAFLISSAWNVPAPPLGGTAPAKLSPAFEPTENRFWNKNFAGDLSGAKATLVVSAPRNSFEVPSQSAELLKIFPRPWVLLDCRFSCKDQKAEFGVVVVKVTGIQSDDAENKAIPFPSPGPGERFFKDEAYGEDNQSVRIEGDGYTRYFTRTFSATAQVSILWELMEQDEASSCLQK